MLRLREVHYRHMVVHAVEGNPLEACGLVAGRAGSGEVEIVYPCGNDAASATLYTVNPRDHLKADRDAESKGLEIIGVFHSHTHTEAYPSPTDVAQAPDPNWHYILISLMHDEPLLRSFHIVDGKISEENVVVDPQ